MILIQAETWFEQSRTWRWVDGFFLAQVFVMVGWPYAPFFPDASWPGFLYCLKYLGFGFVCVRCMTPVPYVFETLSRYIESKQYRNPGQDASGKNGTYGHPMLWYISESDILCLLLPKKCLFKSRHGCRQAARLNSADSRMLQSERDKITHTKKHEACWKLASSAECWFKAALQRPHGCVRESVEEKIILLQDGCKNTLFTTFIRNPLVGWLKGYYTQKWKFFHHLFTLKSSQLYDFIYAYEHK